MTKKVENKEEVSNSTLFKSLTGDSVQKADIKFNNMVPFFGAKVTGPQINSHNESHLDNRAGSGTLNIDGKVYWGATIDYDSREYREISKLSSGQFAIISGTNSL